MQPEFFASTVPAGLVDENIEFMVQNGEVKFTMNGSLHNYGELTVDDFDMIQRTFNKDFKAQNGMELLGIYDPEERLKRYIFCRFGGCNNTPDVDHESHDLDSEYWNCGCRPCLGDGLICKYPKVDEGHLTLNEMAIVRQICKDKSNKMIAYSFNRSTETINKEIKRICEKIGCHTKYGVAAFAGANNMI